MAPLTPVLTIIFGGMVRHCVSVVKRRVDTFAVVRIILVLFGPWHLSSHRWVEKGWHDPMRSPFTGLPFSSSEASASQRDACIVYLGSLCVCGALCKTGIEDL
jgi:hypothetical protein